MKQYLWILLLFSGSCLLKAQEIEFPVPGNRPPGIFQYLQQDTILEIHFKTDLKPLNRYVRKPGSQPAQMQLTRPGGTVEDWSVKLEQRGKLRRRMCEHKPLKIEFRKKALAAHQLDSLKSVKLVIGCQAGRKSDELVLKEYLAYRLYNILTEKSYRVQLVKATFEDSMNTVSSYTSYGFLLEPEREMSRRNYAVTIERMGISAEKLEERDYVLVAVFEYLIGNTDWLLAANHNIDLLRYPGRDKYGIVAYDFDFSGLVGASYAAPDPNLPIKQVTERLFLGSYEHQEVLDEVLDLFRSKEDEMKALVQGFHYLHPQIRKHCWQYLAEFFRSIRDKRQVPGLFPKAAHYQNIMDMQKVKIKE